MDGELVIDALGLQCPLPVLRLRKRIAGREAGTLVRLLADDPAALIDVPHFCQEAGHEFLGSEPAGGDPDSPASAYLVRLR